MSEFRSKFDQAIWQTVAAIKPGQVMSYGQVARSAGFPRHARMVSKAMARSPEKLPWHRVIKSDFTLAFNTDSEAYTLQQGLLEKEGIYIISGKVIPTEQDSEKSLDELMWGPE